jgi:helix-turn-helix protein
MIRHRVRTRKLQKYLTDVRGFLVMIVILSAPGGIPMIDFISPRKAAKKLHISLNATYTAIWTGRLQGKKRDGKWLVSVHAVDEYLRRRRSRQTAKNTPAKPQGADFKRLAAGDRE